MSPEEKKETAAQKLDVSARLDELVEEPENVGDIGEGQHQQSLLQLTEEKNKHILSTVSHSSFPLLFFLLLYSSRFYPLIFTYTQNDSSKRLSYVISHLLR